MFICKNKATGKVSQAIALTEPTPEKTQELRHWIGERNEVSRTWSPDIHQPWSLDIVESEQVGSNLMIQGYHILAGSEIIGEPENIVLRDSDNTLVCISPYAFSQAWETVEQQTIFPPNSSDFMDRNKNHTNYRHRRSGERVEAVYLSADKSVIEQTLQQWVKKEEGATLHYRTTVNIDGEVIAESGKDVAVWFPNDALVFYKEEEFEELFKSVFEPQIDKYPASMPTDNMEDSLRETAISDILDERERHAATWDIQNHDPLTYAALITEEVGKLTQSALKNCFDEEKRAIRPHVLSVAAVALAMVECLDREEWEWRGEEQKKRPDVRGVALYRSVMDDQIVQTYGIPGHDVSLTKGEIEWLDETIPHDWERCEKTGTLIIHGDNDLMVYPKDYLVRTKNGFQRYTEKNFDHYFTFLA